MLSLFNNFDQLKRLPIDNSPYFKWSEALYLPAVQAYAKPTIEQATNIMRVCKYLDAIRAHYNTPITINSWLRPDKYNKLIGGAMFSHHRTGLAVDFEVLGLTAEKVRQDMKVNKFLVPGCSFENSVTWVHMQLDGRGIFFDPPPKKGPLV